MAQQRRLPRLFPEQELTFTCPLDPNLLPRPRPRPRHPCVGPSESKEAACRAPQISPGSEAEMQSIFRSCITERQVGGDFQCWDNRTQSRHKRQQTGSGEKVPIQIFLESCLLLCFCFVVVVVVVFFLRRHKLTWCLLYFGLLRVSRQETWVSVRCCQHTVRSACKGGTFSFLCHLMCFCRVSLPLLDENPQDFK